MDNNDRKYVVYKHTSPDNKVYIGITSQVPPEKRWANGHGYTTNKYFSNEIMRYKWDSFTHEILFDNLTRPEAQQKEFELIKHYKSTDKNFGYNISASGIGDVSDEVKKRIMKYYDGINPLPVVQYTLLGEFIKIFDSASVAEEETGICGTNIIKCCKQQLKSAGKFVWRYADVNLNVVDYNYKINKQVVQYTKDGKFIYIYNSIIDAAMKNNVDQSSITKCCKGKLRTVGGFIWRYASEIVDPESPLFSILSETA